MSLRLTVLCENSVERVDPPGLLGEHGFACHIQTDEGAYLFDTGGGLTILANSDSLGIDLAQLQGIILSHGHLDHSGGLEKILHRTGQIPVYAHPELFQSRYSNNGHQLRDIGLPWSRQQLEAMGAVFQLERAPQTISRGLILSGEVPRQNSFESGDPKLLSQSSSGQTTRDRLADDLSVFIDTPEGLVILLGCAHAGVVNIIEHARTLTGQRRIRLLLGGTHLKFCSEEQLEKTLEKLEALEIGGIGGAHCTGRHAMQKLEQRFGERFFQASVGTTVTL